MKDFLDGLEDSEYSDSVFMPMEILIFRWYGGFISGLFPTMPRRCEWQFSNAIGNPLSS
jgi:hypothetical protein